MRHTRLPEASFSPRRVSLDPEPRSVGVARRAVDDLLRSTSLEELADTATLLVSELVTNAVLHTATPVELRCSAGPDWVLVEVCDRSPVRPSLRNYDDDAMTGRGLAMVELLADAWGVEPEGRGKKVWFRLGAEDTEAAPEAQRTEVGMDLEHFEVFFLNAPTALLLHTVQYGDSVLRELALTALAKEVRPPTEPAWQGAHVDLGPLLRAVESSEARGESSSDLTVLMPVGSGGAALERLTLIEEADQLAREGRLLSAPTLPELGACRHWLLSQIALQEEGQPPRAWRMPDDLSSRTNCASLPSGCAETLEALTIATILADDGDRIIYANAVACRLLGWDDGGLIGERLLTIIPPELRERHLTAFGRYLVTGRPRTAGRNLRVEALQRDGGRIPVDLTISAVDLGDGRLTFRGQLSPPADH